MLRTDFSAILASKFFDIENSQAFAHKRLDVSGEKERVCVYCDKYYRKSIDERNENVVTEKLLKEECIYRKLE